MPRKPTTTKEAMIQAAFRLVREQGHPALTARNLAAALGCSTQPIMYQFPNLDVLKDLTYQKADAFHSAYILSGRDLLEIGLRYIRFAEEEPNLFRFLFQSERFSGSSLKDLFNAPECGGILSVVCEEQGLSKEEAIAFFEPLFAVVHGYASLLAGNAVKYDPDAVRQMLLKVADGLMKGRERSE